MYGRNAIDSYRGGDYELSPNRLRAEIARLGKWRAAAPLRIQSTSAGFLLSLEGGARGSPTRFVNMSNSVCPAGGCVKIYDTNQAIPGRATFLGMQPDNNWGRYYAIATASVEPKETGECSFFTWLPTAAVINGYGGGYSLGPRPWQWELCWDYPGFLYCGMLPTNAKPQALVIQQTVDALVGYTVGTVTPAGGMVALAVPTVGGWQQTNMLITCGNHLLNGGELIGVGRKVLCQWVNSAGWIVTQAEAG